MAKTGGRFQRNEYSHVGSNPTIINEIVYNNIMGLELIGWISAIAFAICGAPQAYKCYKEGHGEGLAWSFLILWYIGEVFGLIYVIQFASAPLIINYTFNVLFVSIILRYRAFPRK